MAAALAGALPKAKAATPGAKTAAAQAGKGQAATVRPKKRSGAARRRSAQAALEASSRPVEAPCAPLPPRGFERETLEVRRTRVTNWSTRLWNSLHCHPAANIDLARAAVLARRRARLLLN